LQGAEVTPSSDIARLIEIMAALRDPKSGCPWDLEQTFATIAPFTLEEAAEVADAIARNDLEDLREELGDLLLQVVFHARMAEEAGAFAFPDVVQAITEKLIRRHPHVFGNARHLSPDEVKKIWDQIKITEKTERAKKREAETTSGILDGVQTSLPALSRAVALQAKAGTVGFDWNDARTVLDKIREETNEVEETLGAAVGEDERIDEIGDLLFAVANLARHMKVDPEIALRRANAKFERRFRFIEARLAEQNRTPAQSNLDEMDGLWNAAKAAEKR